MGEGIDVGNVYLTEKLYQTANDRRILFGSLLSKITEYLELYNDMRVCDSQFPLGAEEYINEMAIRLGEIFPRYGLNLCFDPQEDFFLKEFIAELENFKEKINGQADPADLTYLNCRMEKIINLLF